MKLTSLLRRLGIIFMALREVYLFWKIFACHDGRVRVPMHVIWVDLFLFRMSHTITLDSYYDELRIGEVTFDAHYNELQIAEVR